MKNILPAFFITAVVLILAPTAQAVPFGYSIEASGSGFVSLRGMNASCTAVALAPDLLLAPSSCISASEVQHPELLGWFMGGQDSVENPVREVTLEPAHRPRFALLRLANPLTLVTAAPRLFRAPLTLPKTVSCTGYGPQNPAVLFPNDGTLSRRDDYVIADSSFEVLLRTSGAYSLTTRDLGSVCIDPASGQIVAMVVDGGLNSVARSRAWVEEYRARFEVVPEHSGLCLGNFPNGTLVWQTPCLPSTNPARIDQRWLIRRIASGVQIRPTRFPDLCLSVTGGSGNDGAEVRFSSCLPTLTSPYPGSLPTTPRPEQVWIATNVAGEAVQLRNSLTGKCLDVAAASRLAAARLQQWTCSAGQANQRFLINVDSFAAGTHQLGPLNDLALNLGVRFADRANGTQIISWTRNGLADQEFTVTPAAGGPYQSIQTMTAGSCVDVPTGGPIDAALQQWTCWGGTNQQFMFRWLPSLSVYRIHPRHTPSRCLTIGPGMVAGTPPTSAPCSGPITGSLDPQAWIVE